MVSGDDIRCRFKSCGTDVVIEPGVYIEHPENFTVGDRVTLMRGVTVIGAGAEIRLGDDVTLYPNVFIQGRGRLIVGDDVQLFPNNYISIGGGLVEIGSRTHFAPGCVLYGQGELRVGDCCTLAAHTVLATVGHDHRRKGLLIEGSRRAPITLTRDIWTGANSTIIGGVTVAEGCVIGAGAVLTHDTEPYGVYLGVPARRAYSRMERSSP